MSGAGNGVLSPYEQGYHDAIGDVNDIIEGWKAFYTDEVKRRVCDIQGDILDLLDK